MTTPSRTDKYHSLRKQKIFEVLAIDSQKLFLFVHLFHKQILLDFSGGTDENTIASTRSEVLSDSEPTQDRY